jgi:hypothetical protein
VAPSSQGKDNFQTTAPQAFNAADVGTPNLVIRTTEVTLPVTVKDNKGKLVAGLTWRDFKIFEHNGTEGRDDRPGQSYNPNREAPKQRALPG